MKHMLFSIALLTGGLLITANLNAQNAKLDNTSSCSVSFSLDWCDGKVGGVPVPCSGGLCQGSYITTNHVVAAGSSLTVFNPFSGICNSGGLIQTARVTYSGSPTTTFSTNICSGTGTWNYAATNCGGSTVAISTQNVGSVCSGGLHDQIITTP